MPGILPPAAAPTPGEGRALAACAADCDLVVVVAAVLALPFTGALEAAAVVAAFALAETCGPGPADAVA